jgi:superfamily II DNA/RNA helicase
MIRRGHLPTRNIEMLLDEADELSTKGFRDQIYGVHHYLPLATQVGGVLYPTLPYFRLMCWR